MLVEVNFTSLIFFCRSLVMRKEITVNRPFIYLIRDDVTELILFIGKVNDPTINWLRLGSSLNDVTHVLYCGPGFNISYILTLLYCILSCIDFTKPHLPLTMMTSFMDALVLILFYLNTVHEKNISCFSSFFSVMKNNVDNKLFLTRLLHFWVWVGLGGRP